ncbi:hypothetical protein PVNG_02404 [Plasmodium vivax North Korean]|uniref:Type I restriction modification DNA specificity domain-containing protein n=1 Tax=Plasmodium vivax North Korean TaxID=1035514 RepID=A0A0J9TM71_PLAVI|nr:hypothetical protein PVNG_02404 [Plasmodium vivax North Korean]
MYYYFLNCSKEIIHKLKKGGVISHIYKSDLKKLKVKLPSLEIQKEIVKILDKFSSKLGIIDTLKEEKRMRDLQYQYYRNLLTTSPKPINDN